MSSCYVNAKAASRIIFACAVAMPRRVIAWSPVPVPVRAWGSVSLVLSLKSRIGTLLCTEPLRTVAYSQLAN